MKILLIGTGMVAPKHVAAIKGAGFTLHGVMGRNPARTEAFAQEHGGTAVTTIEDALALAPDMVIVTTPPDARDDLTAAFTKAGIPTLMEKPIERTLPAARAIVEAYEAADVPLGLVFQHRTAPTSRKLKSLVEDGALGDLLHTEIHVPWWRDQGYYDEPGRGTYARDGGGVMLTQAIHVLDLALWLCGPVAELQAMMRTTPLHQMESEDLATALLRFENGATGHLFATTAAAPGAPETITLTCTKASATVTRKSLIIHWADGRTEEFSGTNEGSGGGVDPMAFSHHHHQAVIEDFAAALPDGPAPISGRSGLAVHAVIDAMERAAKSGATEPVHT